MNDNDLKNLEVVFSLARRGAIDNEPELANLIVYKKDLLERIKNIINPKAEDGKGDTVQP